MTNYKLPQAPALKIRYIDSAHGELIEAYVYRKGAYFMASCTAEDVRAYLRSLIETTSFNPGDGDLDVLRLIASHLSDGVNRYGRRETLIVKRSDVLRPL